MSSWLSEREQMLVEGAEKNNLDLPVPTQIVSNGEYLPPKQSDMQKKVEKRMLEMADENAKHLGLSRRQFLQTSCGMATAFLAMNEIYGGGVFDVSKAEARDPELTLARTNSLSSAKYFAPGCSSRKLTNGSSIPEIQSSQKLFADRRTSASPMRRLLAKGSTEPLIFTAAKMKSLSSSKLLEALRSSCSKISSSGHSLKKLNQ